MKVLWGTIWYDLAIRRFKASNVYWLKFANLVRNTTRKNVGFVICDVNQMTVNEVIARHKVDNPSASILPATSSYITMRSDLSIVIVL